MGANMREEIMIFDLNQEPPDQPHDPVIGFESILSELETAHGRIEERIRQLEAVTSRARERRQRWRQARVSPQIMNITAGVVAVDTQNESIQSGDDALAARETTVETGKTNRSDSTHLVAKALAMDTTVKKAVSRTESFFDCNICLGMARDPILTCCGHLFCWPCFYQLSYADSNAKECPVCRGEVTDTSIFPIYGNGDDNCSHKSKESVLMAPPRPHARRIEGLRQQLVRQGPTSTLIEERIQQLSNIVGAMGERRRSRDLFGAHVMPERTSFLPGQYQTSQASPSTETTSNQHHDSLQVSRLLLQGASSVSSLSSALNTAMDSGASSVSSLSSALNTAMDSAERLVEDLEAYSSSHHMRRNNQQSLRTDDGDTSSSIAAVIQLETQTSDTAAEINSDVLPSSFLRTDIDPIFLDLEDQTMDSEINSRLLSSSFRRRSNVPRGSDVNNGHLPEPIRRRLS